MLSWIWAASLKDKGVTVNACHPGVINTQLLKDLGFSSHASPSQGASTPIWLATSKELDGVTNKWFDNKQEMKCNFRNATELDKLWNKLTLLSKI